MRISVTIGVLIFGWLAVSCSTEKKATKAFRNGEYQKAIGLYKKAKSKEPGKVNYFVAESYRLSNRLKEAEKYYEKAGGRGIDKDSVQFYYAESLKANAKYEEARKELEELQNRTVNEKMKDRAQAEIDGLQYLSNLKQKPSYYRVKNLELLNSPYSEYAPAYLNNELYYTSSRSNGKIYEATGTPFTNLFKVASR